MRDVPSDSDLHCFVPFERMSPDGTEIWLNWAGRDKVSTILGAADETRFFTASADPISEKEAFKDSLLNS